MEWKVGDKIRMSSAADLEYGQTRGGSEGVILYPASAGRFGVAFYKLPNGSTTTTEVSSRYFEPISPATPEDVKKAAEMEKVLWNGSLFSSITKVPRGASVSSIRMEDNDTQLVIRGTIVGYKKGETKPERFAIKFCLENRGTSVVFLPLPAE